MTCWLRRLFFIGYKYVFFVCDNAGRRTFHGIFRVNFSLFMTRGENSLHSKKKKDFLLMIVSQHWFLQFPSKFFFPCRPRSC